MWPEVPITSPLPGLDACLAGSSLPAANSEPAAQLDSPSAGGRNHPGAAPATSLDFLSTAQSGQRDQMPALPPSSNMIRTRGIQSVRSPEIRCPRMSNALQVSFPSSQRTQPLGRPLNSAFRVAGVRARTAVASARLNSVRLIMPTWTHAWRFGVKRRPPSLLGF